MQLKTNVRFGSNSFAMAIAAIVVNDVYKKYNYDCVITSVNDSSHGTNSLHFSDGAIDFRTKHLSKEDKPKIIAEIKTNLNDAAYDIVYEHDGQINEHLHIEYDIK